MVVGQPAQQPHGLGHLGGARCRAAGTRSRLVGQVPGGLPHPRPVLDRLPDVLEHPSRPAASSSRSLRVGLPVDLDVDPGLRRRRPAARSRGLRVVDRSRTSSRAPVTSRRTTNCGCTTRWMAWSCRDSSAVTESTRNGMSSVTISTTVCPIDQPCSSTDGVNTRTLATPGGRCDGQLPVHERGAGEVDGIAVAQVLQRGVLVVPGEELRQVLVPAALAFPRLHGPFDEQGAVVVVMHRSTRASAGAVTRSPPTIPSAHAARSMWTRRISRSPGTLRPVAATGLPPARHRSCSCTSPTRSTTRLTRPRCSPCSRTPTSRSASAGPPAPWSSGWTWWSTAPARWRSRTERVLPTDTIPEAFRSMLGGSLRVIQVETWRPDDGVRRAQRDDRGEHRRRPGRPHRHAAAVRRRHGRARLPWSTSTAGSRPRSR